MPTKREKQAEDNYYKKKKTPLKWENLLTKCEKCGSTDLIKMNLYQGMFRKGEGLNYQMHKCKACGKEQFIEI